MAASTVTEISALADRLRFYEQVLGVPVGPMEHILAEGFPSGQFDGELIIAPVPMFISYNGYDRVLGVNAPDDVQAVTRHPLVMPWICTVDSRIGDGDLFEMSGQGRSLPVGWPDIPRITVTLEDHEFFYEGGFELPIWDVMPATAPVIREWQTNLKAAFQSSSKIYAIEQMIRFNASWSPEDILDGDDIEKLCEIRGVDYATMDWDWDCDDLAAEMCDAKYQAMCRELMNDTEQYLVDPLADIYLGPALSEAYADMVEHGVSCWTALYNAGWNYDPDTERCPWA